MMTKDEVKLEVIKWICELDDLNILLEIEEIMIGTNESANPKSRDLFGSGKHLFGEMSDDFDEPLEEFKDYM